MSDDQNKMTDTGGGLDDLFRTMLGSRQIEPSAGLWKGISRKLLRTELAHFRFTNVPKAFWIGAAAVILVGAFFLLKPVSNESTIVKSPSPSPSSDRTPATSSISSKEEKKTQKAVQPPGAKTEVPVVNKTLKASIKSKPAEYALNLPKVTNPGLPPAPEPAEKPASGEISPGQPVRNPYGYDLNYMATGNIPELHTIPAEDTILRFITPQGITSVPVSKREIPQFFSANMGVSPELAVYRNSVRYTETNYWVNAGLTYHAGKFSVQTGVGLGYVYNQNSYRVNYKSKDSIGYFTSIISFTVSPGNQIVYTTKDIAVYDSIQHFADDRAVSRYTYVQIPLMLGYELVSTNHFSLGIKVGPSVSFLIGSREAQPFIDYPNATLVRVDDNSLERVKVNWELQAALDLDYRITKQFSIYAQPYYKHYFQPFVEQESESVKDPFSFGIEVGAKVHFGTKSHKTGPFTK
ncbi:MAG: outer membrane beta-barrel protein [Bacteroidetes bacterium]|nr:outer membrane beta-barrel protein [Bacteroidota bacterium]